MSALSGVLAQTPAQKALLYAFLLVSAVNLSSNLLNDISGPPAGSPTFTCQCEPAQGVTGTSDADKLAAERTANDAVHARQLAAEKTATQKPFATPAFISKVLLMPLLAAFLFLRTRGATSDIPRLALMLALFTCWLGDIFLGLPQKDGSLYFMLGMGAFGVAHLFYIRAFLKAVDLKRLDLTVLAYGLPFLVYAFMMYSVLYHDMVDPDELPLRLPLGLYMVVLISNGVSGFLRFHQQRSLSAASIFAGVVLFVQSDSFIAVSMFVDQELPLESFSVMATYILGQYLIIRGCVLRTQELPVQQEPRAPLLAAA